MWQELGWRKPSLPVDSGPGTLRFERFWFFEILARVALPALAMVDFPRLPFCFYLCLLIVDFEIRQEDHPDLIPLDPKSHPNNNSLLLLRCIPE